MDDVILGKRYEYDGKPIRDLNDEQIQSLERVKKAINQGEYELGRYCCTVCDNKDFQLLSEKDRYGLPINVVICGECGLIQNNPRFTPEASSKFYDEEYRTLYDLKDAEHSFNKQINEAPEIYDYIISNVELEKSDINVLEIGCGYGGLVSYFQSKGHTVLGCDLDSEAIEYGKEKGLPVIHSDIRDLSLKWNPDVVILDDVLEHLTDPAGLLEFLVNRFGEETYVYIDLPGVKNLHYRRTFYNGDFLRYIHIAHTHHFSLKSLDNLMSVSGYELVEGDERIRALFRTGGKKGKNRITSDYEEIISHIKKLEKNRKLKLNKVGTLHKNPTTIRILKRLGVYPVSKKAYNIIK